MPVVEAVTKAIDDLGGTATREQLKARVHILRPGTKESTLNAHLVSMAVNSPSRIHFRNHNNTKFPRRFRPEMEVLFRRGNVFDRYNRERHGIWELRLRDDGTVENHLRDDGTASDELSADAVDVAVAALADAEVAGAAGGQFAARRTYGITSRRTWRGLREGEKVDLVAV